MFHLKATYKLTIRTKRFLRKPLVESFNGAWKSEDEVRRIVAKFRPKAEIVSIDALSIDNEKKGDVDVW